MSQLTAVRTASRTVGSTQWWHLSLSTGGFDVADGIVDELVTPLVAQAHALGAKRWYFTRAKTQSGDQVRLNIQAHPRVIERLRMFQRALQSRRGGVLPKITVVQHLSSPVSTLYSFGSPLPTDPQLESDVLRYGGIEGLELAEEVFELSSELAAWATQRFTKTQSRSALGALLLFDAAQSMMRGPRSGSWPQRRKQTWEAYWDNHLEICTTEVGPRAGSVREAMRQQVSVKTPPFHALMGATTAEAAVQAWRRRWFRGLDSYLERAEKARVSRTAQHLTVHQAHGTINRLGFLPREEAALGLYARTWQPPSRGVRSRSSI